MSKKSFDEFIKYAIETDIANGEDYAKGNFEAVIERCTSSIKEAERLFMDYDKDEQGLVLRWILHFNNDKRICKQRLKEFGVR